MVNLGDYIGKLLTELTIARANADMESLRVAEFYKSHPVLKYFSVPRIRIPSAELTIQVIVSDVEDDTDQKVDTTTVLSASKKAIFDVLKKRNIALTEPQLTALNAAINRKSQEIKNLREKPTSIGIISKPITDTIIDRFIKIPSVKKELDKPNEKLKITREIKDIINSGLLEKRKLPPRIKVSPLTKDLKEIVDNEKMVSLKLMIEDDSLEWSRIEDDGKEIEILVPE